MPEPKVRFKRDDGSSYPAWERKRLGEITKQVTLRNGMNDCYPVYSVNNQKGFIPQRDQFEEREVASADRTNYKVVAVNQFAYNPSRINVGSIAYLKENLSVIVSPLYVVFECRNGLSERFLNEYVRTNYFHNQRRVHAEGSVRDSLSYDGFANIEMWLPCCEEQQCIIDFLASIDDVISFTEKEIVNLHVQKKDAMNKIFSKTVRFKRPDGNQFPEWEKICLGDRFTFKNGVNASKEAFELGGIKCIGVSDVYKCLPIKAENVDGEVSLNNKDIERYSVNYGDVLFQRSSETKIDIGRASVYVDNTDAVFNGFVICAKPQEMFYDPIFLHNALQTKSVREQTIRLGAGAQHFNIGQDGLASISILFPCLEEQRLIADFLSDFDEAIAAAKKELELWKKLKKGLLQQMFV